MSLQGVANCIRYALQLQIMKPHFLFFPSLLAALVGGVVCVVSTIHVPLRAAFIVPLTYICAALAMALFLRMTFDPRWQRGIALANREMQGEPRRALWIGFNNPRWGICGTRTGGRLLRTVRALLFFEFIAALVLAGIVGADLLLLSAASFAVATMLSLLHVGLNAEDARPNLQTTPAP